MKRITIGLNDVLKKELTKESKEKGLSLSSYIRLVLNERKK